MQDTERQDDSHLSQGRKLFQKRNEEGASRKNKCSNVSNPTNDPCIWHCRGHCREYFWKSGRDESLTGQQGMEGEGALECSLLGNLTVKGSGPGRAQSFREFNRKGERPWQQDYFYQDTSQCPGTGTELEFSWIDSHGPQALNLGSWDWNILGDYILPARYTDGSSSA